MRTSIRQQLDAGGRGDAFCQSHPDPNPATALVATRLHDLTGRGLTLAQIQHQSQVARAEAVARKENLRVSITGNLVSLTGISKAAARIEPGIMVHRGLPTSRTNETRFLTTARVAVAEAMAKKDVLSSAGMPENLLEGLTAELDEYEAAQVRQRNALAAQVAASAELTIVSREIVAVLRHLDALHRLRFKAVPDMLAAWMSARNVAYRLSEPPQAPADDTRAA